MRWDLDCEAEAEMAMRHALEATTAIERANWVRAALAWQDLARDQDPLRMRYSLADPEGHDGAREAYRQGARSRYRDEVN
jgi:hypothetical protein